MRPVLTPAEAGPTSFSPIRSHPRSTLGRARATHPRGLTRPASRRQGLLPIEACGRTWSSRPLSQGKWPRSTSATDPERGRRGCRGRAAASISGCPVRAVGRRWPPRGRGIPPVDTTAFGLPLGRSSRQLSELQARVDPNRADSPDRIRQALRRARACGGWHGTSASPPVHRCACLPR